MSTRRMLSYQVIESDDFYALPASAQTLYFHLNMNADDDGMVGGVKRIMRSLGARSTTLALLEEHGYIIRFETGVVAITHWLLHNHVRRDRYVQTRFKRERDGLVVNDSEEYQRISGTFGCQNSNLTSTEDSKGKDSKGKDSKGKVSKGKVSEVKSPVPSIAPSGIETETHEKEAQNDASLEKYNVFLSRVNFYARVYYAVSDAADFIREYEACSWLDGTVNVKNEYRKYLDEWMSEHGIRRRAVFCD